MPNPAAAAERSPSTAAPAAHSLDDRYSRARLIAAFAAVYVIWGSTYLAIRYSVQTIPPFLMGGSRFIVSGAILVAWARLRGERLPSKRDWLDATITGVLLLCGGNGAVAWAEQRVPSGIAALLVAVVPLWMVLIDWLRPHGTRPKLSVMIGIIIGLGGLALLVLSVGAAGLITLAFALIAVNLGRRGRARAVAEGIGGYRAARWGVTLGIVLIALSIVVIVAWVLILVFDWNITTDVGRDSPSAPTDLSTIALLLRGHL